MARPTRYFIEHDITTEADPEPRIEYTDAPTFIAARKLAAAMTGYVAIIERRHITDETPPEDGVGLIYDWDEVKAWES